MRITQRIKFMTILAAIAACIVVVVVAVNAHNASGSPFPAATVISTIPDTSQTRGPIGATLLTPAGLRITLVGVDKSSTRWLFHLKVSNSGNAPATILGTNKPMSGSSSPDQGGFDHQFAIPVIAADATVGGLIQQRVLDTPAAGELAAHPTLVAMVAGGETADGWLGVDITNIGSPVPSELVYNFDPLPSEKFSNPSDQSTCTPETLYHVLIWDLN